MQSVMKKNFTFSLANLILFFLFLALTTTFYYYIKVEDPKIYSLVGGLGCGIAIQIIAFITSYYEYRQIDRFRAMGVVDILPDRRNQEYYKKIIRNAKDSIQVMGTSCTRFINDFADQNSNDHVLIDALNKNTNLSVQFLIPMTVHMDNETKLKFEAGKNKFVILKDKFGSRVEMRQHDFQARHSMVRVDSTLVVGPVFQNVESQNSPAVHLDVVSVFAEKYLHYFRSIWITSQVTI